MPMEAKARNAPEEKKESRFTNFIWNRKTGKRVVEERATVIRRGGRGKMLVKGERQRRKLMEKEAHPYRRSPYLYLSEKDCWKEAGHYRKSEGGSPRARKRALFLPRGKTVWEGKREWHEDPAK